MQEKTTSRRRVLQASGGALAASTGFVGAAAAGHGSDCNMCDAVDGTVFEDQTVSYIDCDTGVVDEKTHSVEVAESYLPCGGFVDIHDPDEKRDGKYKGGIGIGATKYLEPGTYHDICIDLFEHNGHFGSCVGDDWERDRLQEGQTLNAMPHLDTDGDEKFTHWCSHQDDGTVNKAGEGADHAYICDKDGDGDKEPVFDSAFVSLV